MTEGLKSVSEAFAKGDYANAIPHRILDGVPYFDTTGIDIGMGVAMTDHGAEECLFLEVRLPIPGMYESKVGYIVDVGYVEAMHRALGEMVEILAAKGNR